MKITKRKIALFALAVFLLISLIWRVLPHSLSDVVSIDTSEISKLTCNATISGVLDGEPFIDTYSMLNLTSDGEHFSEIIKILNSTSYRQDFRNLLPLPITSVSGDGSTRSANFSFSWGDAQEQTCHISYLDKNIISVSHRGNDGFKIYHPTDHAAINLLVEYLQLHGAKAE